MIVFNGVHCTSVENSQFVRVCHCFSPIEPVHVLVPVDRKNCSIMMTIEFVYTWCLWLGGIFILSTYCNKFLLAHPEEQLGLLTRIPMGEEN
jgi:hypothetical protein